MANICTCPYCGTTLSINVLPVEKTASRCPHCKNILLLTDYGATLKKPYVYKCHKCGEESIYDGRVPFVKCDKCGTLYITAEQGTSMIEADLLVRGDKGELPYTKKKDRYIAARNRFRMLPTRAKIVIFACIIALFSIAGVAYYHSLPSPIEESLAYANMEELWDEFRGKNPYNFQVVGLRHYDDNSYTAIISEPTEDVTEEQLNAVFKKYNCVLKTFKKKIGYDGWLRDAVVCFNDASKKDVQKIARKVFKTLYGTDYKAEFMDFTILPEHTAFSEHDLNFQVTEEELRQWFITEEEVLVDIEKPSNETTLKACLEKESGDMQVLMSKTPGFIIWVMDVGTCDSDKFRISARKFSVDSDIIFGAITNEKRVAIIARERCIPLYELPPMRQEILHLLAATDEDELAQSYERTSLFAGKQQGGKDFAPIYLSNELWHTEYGNILNITDQMLKSWSENGTIEYTEFGYPKPVNWTFDEGVHHDLGVSQLTYNWNTAGVGYEVGDEDYTIYALNRTGSLPVSYIPGETDGISDNDPVYRAEEQAYDFFSELSSPELVKVVQYVSMYQIYRNFGVHCSGYYYNEDGVMRVPSELVDQADRTLSAITRFGFDEKKKIAESLGLDVLTERDFQSRNEYYYGFQIDGDYRITKKGRTTDSYYEILEAASLISEIDSIRDALRYIKADGTFMSCLPSYLLDRNGTKLSYNGNADNNRSNLSTLSRSNGLPIASSSRHFDNYEDRIFLALSAMGKRGFEMQRFNFIVGSISVEESKNLYLEVNKDKSKTWMKCPTIVESWDAIDSVNSVGGHNLNSKVTKFRIASDLKPGQTRETIVNGRKIVEISKADMRSRGTDPSYLRRVGRLDNTKLLTRDIPVRTKTEVLKGVSERSSRGLNVTDHMTIRAKGTAFELNGKKVSLTELFDHINESMQHGTSPIKEIEIVGLDGAGTEVSAIIDGISYHMPKGQRANLAMAKYDFASHTVDYTGDRAVIKIPIKAGKVEYGSNSKVIQAGFNGSNTKIQMLDVKSGELILEVRKPIGYSIEQFKNIIEQFIEAFKKEKSRFFDERKLHMKMKQFNISPSDCNEKQHLKVARHYLQNNNSSKQYVRTIQEENVA